MRLQTQWIHVQGFKPYLRVCISACTPLMRTATVLSVKQM